MKMMNSTRRKFDIELEILASIPPEPAGVPLHTLCSDMGFTDQRELGKVLSPLVKRYGLSVRNGGYNRGKIISLPVQTSKAIQTRAAHYMNDVYGEGESDE
jgi:hypothetical protein